MVRKLITLLYFHWCTCGLVSSFPYQSYPFYADDLHRILHLVSFASNGYNGYRYFIMDRPRCPHCHQKMSANWTLPRFVPTQTESASPPPGPSTVRGEDLIANDNEEGEGDRLIVKH